MEIESDLVGVVDHILQTYSPSEINQLIRLISPAPDCALMTAAEFERVMRVLAGQSRSRPFSEKSIQSARLILVMGASVAEAAADVGLARQVVHRLMMRIRARLQQLPGEWVKVEAWLPPAAARQVADLAAELRLTHQAGRGESIPLGSAGVDDIIIDR
ncbi:hypothetical protein ALQ72_01391 [Pseudomonas syringae pv. maculicola]|uniref:TrfB-related DNA-binding protein n=2 Tax=Pseudomonas syringae group genomosp. 3 TaxID=251701 RepID=UPI000B0C4233|nr:TrfB-related DNA-binding protein [Pseudomonas syringae group genomosp. 3]RMM84424.1 hypothetical protein ALQ72_01391 [Pseudomonas syringae pv. maculicola]